MIGLGLEDINSGGIGCRGEDWLVVVTIIYDILLGINQNFFCLFW